MERESDQCRGTRWPLQRKAVGFLASWPSTELLSFLSELSLSSTQAPCSELIFSLRAQTRAPDKLVNKPIRALDSLVLIWLLLLSFISKNTKLVLACSHSTMSHILEAFTLVFLLLGNPSSLGPSPAPSLHTFHLAAFLASIFR